MSKAVRPVGVLGWCFESIGLYQEIKKGDYYEMVQIRDETLFMDS